jgi:glycerol-3-phosphate acyltransferase PlsY
MDDLIDYLGAYLIGSIPVGYLLLKVFKGMDLRKKAKEGTGLPQVWKAAGVSWGLLTLAMDILKGGSVVFMAHHLSPTDPPDMVMAGFLVWLADEFPPFFHFKGGRSMGVVVGVFAALLLCMMGK